MRDRALKIVSRVMRVPVTDLNDQSCSANVATWDSIAHMLLIVSIEEEFGVRFDTHDVIYMKDLGELLAKLGELIK